MGKLKLSEPSESEIELLICHYLTARKIFFWKAISTGYFNPSKKKFIKQHNPFSLNGVPDLCLIIEGKFYGWEIKTRIGKQTDSQIRFEERLEKEGKASYAIIRSLKEAENELKKIFA